MLCFESVALNKINKESKRGNEKNEGGKENQIHIDLEEFSRNISPNIVTMVKPSTKNILHVFAN